MKRRILQNISNTFHPILSMAWATVLLLNFTPMIVLTFWVKMQMLGEVLLYATILPIAIIVILYKRKRVVDLALSRREDRYIPLVAQVLFLIMLEILLKWQGLPEWALAYYKSGVLLSVIAFVVSLKWKISAHAMGNAAIATIAFLLYCRYPQMVPFALPISFLVILGLVGSIRLYLNRHTLAQVVVGALVGCLCVLIFAL